MQCPACHTDVETSAAGDEPQVCSSCGASLKAPSRRGSGISSQTVLLSLLCLVLAAAAVGAAMLAVRMDEKRKLAEEELGQATAAIDQFSLAVANNSQFKGAKLEETRAELLRPALQYYQNFVKAHADDKRPTGPVAAANLRIAALQARLLEPEATQTLWFAFNYLFEMKTAEALAEEVPSLQTNLLKVTPPSDWLRTKSGSMEDMQKQGMAVYMSLLPGVNIMGEFSKKYPQSAAIRDDLADLLKATASLETLIDKTKAVDSWQRSRDLLEVLVKEKPDNIEYQYRLGEALIAIAKLQKPKDPAAATASYERAQQVCEQLVAAKPDDESYKKALASVKSELEKLKPAEAAPATAEKPAEPEKPAEAEKPAEPPAAAAAPTAEDKPAAAEPPAASP